MCECVFCHKEQIITDFIYEDDGFGWTYSSGESKVNSEIAGRIKKQLERYL